MSWTNITNWTTGQEVESTKLTQMKDNTEYVRDSIAVRKITDRLGEEIVVNGNLVGSNRILRVYINGVYYGTSISLASSLDDDSAPDGTATWQNLRNIDISAGLTDGEFYSISLRVVGDSGNVTQVIEPYFYKNPEITHISFFGNLDWVAGTTNTLTISDIQIFGSNANMSW